MNMVSPRELCAWTKALWDHFRAGRMTRAAVEKRQIQKFRKLVAFANARSPYYAAIIKDRGIDPLNCTPLDFPALTKQDVIEHFDQIVTDPRVTRRRIAEFLARSHSPQELFDGEFHVLHTSGTSGRIGYFVFSHDAWIKGSTQMTRILPPRLRTRVAYVAAVEGHFAGACLLLTGNHGTNHLFYDVRTFDVGRPLSETIAALNAFRPQVLAGYAAVLKLLAEAQTSSALRIKPRLIVSGAEPLRPDGKTFLETAFQAPAVNAYASSEHLFMAMSMPGSDGMYLLEEDLIFELHDDHLCVTNLFNPTLPLIRYRMDDVMFLEPGVYQGPFRKIRDLVGRVEDTLIFTNREGREEYIHPVVIVEFSVPGLHAWQVVVRDKTSFVFRAI